MKNMIPVILVLVSAGTVFSADAEADSLIRAGIGQFMEALQTGDGETASALFSSEAMNQVEAMLNTIKQSLNGDPEGTIRRLISTGYQVDRDMVEDWEPADYLSQTLSLPMISARYIPYQMQIDSVLVNGRSATVDMIFQTASGAQIPQQALMSLEDGVWKVSSFMGITAFP